MRYLTVVILLAIAALAKGQCGQDSAVDHTPVQISMDTIPPPCYPFLCADHDSCHTVELRDSFSGVFELNNADEPFEIIVLDQCRWVVFDTCAIVGSSTPGFALFNTFPPMSTVLICGDGNRDIQVTVKHVPSANFPPFGPPILDLDTLCGPFVALDPIPLWRYAEVYIDPTTMQRVDRQDRIPYKYYLVRKCYQL